jgi:hypothetical protein
VGRQGLTETPSSGIAEATMLRLSDAAALMLPVRAL